MNTLCLLGTVVLSLMAVTADTCGERKYLTSDICCDFQGSISEMIDVEEIETYEEVFKDAYNENMQRSGLDVKMETLKYVNSPTVGVRKLFQNGRMLNGGSKNSAGATTCGGCPYDDVPMGDRRRKLEAISEAFYEEGRFLQPKSFHETFMDYLKTNLTAFSNMTGVLCDICPEVAYARSESSPGVGISNGFGRRLYATSLETGSYGVGGKAEPGGSAVTPDQKWIFQKEDCPAGTNPDADDCFIIRNAHSDRRLYAQKDQKWKHGVGASISSEIYADEFWYLKQANCQDNECHLIINAYSRRALYARKDKDWSDGFGATHPEKEVEVSNWYSHKWKIGEWD